MSIGEARLTQRYTKEMDGLTRQELSCNMVCHNFHIMTSVVSVTLTSTRIDAVWAPSFAFSKPPSWVYIFRTVFNFGVLVSKDPTKHRVVIIDAGSRGMNRGTHWPKSGFNVAVMRKSGYLAAKKLRIL